MITTAGVASHEKDEERSVVLQAIALVRGSTTSRTSRAATNDDKRLAPAAGKCAETAIPVDDTEMGETHHDNSPYNEQISPKTVMELSDMGSSNTLTFNGGGGRVRLDELDIAALLQQWQRKLSLTSASALSQV